MENPVALCGSQDRLGFATGTNMSQILVAETNRVLFHSCGVSVEGGMGALFPPGHVLQPRAGNDCLE